MFLFELVSTPLFLFLFFKVKSCSFFRNNFWYCLKGHGNMNENTLVVDLMAKAINLKQKVLMCQNQDLRDSVCCVWKEFMYLVRCLLSISHLFATCYLPQGHLRAGKGLCFADSGVTSETFDPPLPSPLTSAYYPARDCFVHLYSDVGNGVVLLSSLC